MAAGWTCVLHQHHDLVRKVPPSHRLLTLTSMLRRVDAAAAPSTTYFGNGCSHVVGSLGARLNLVEV